MAGKITKLAAGVLMTHYRRSKVDNALLAEIADRRRRPGLGRRGRDQHGDRPAFRRGVRRHRPSTALAELCRRAAAACAAHVGGVLDVDVTMVDFDGDEVLARG